MNKEKDVMSPILFHTFRTLSLALFVYFMSMVWSDWSAHRNSEAHAAELNQVADHAESLRERQQAEDTRKYFKKGLKGKL